MLPVSVNAVMIIMIYYSFWAAATVCYQKRMRNVTSICNIKTQQEHPQRVTALQVFVYQEAAV